MIDPQLFLLNFLVVFDAAVLLIPDPSSLCFPFLSLSLPAFFQLILNNNTYLMIL